MGSGEWGVESGEWRVENGEWRVESGEGGVESGEWGVGSGGFVDEGCLDNSSVPAEFTELLRL
jgi:hypothetical protein